MHVGKNDHNNLDDLSNFYLDLAAAAVEEEEAWKNLKIAYLVGESCCKIKAQGDVIASWTSFRARSSILAIRPQGQRNLLETSSADLTSCELQ